MNTFHRIHLLVRILYNFLSCRLKFTPVYPTRAQYNEQMQRRKQRGIDIGESDIEVACVRVENKNIAVLFHLYFVTKNGVNCRSAVSKNWKCEMHKLAILAKLFKFFSGGQLQDKRTRLGQFMQRITFSNDWVHI